MIEERSMSSCDMTPVVSVVMTAYNAGSWIEQAIRSILKQTLSDFELVIVDDGSTDDTVRIVRSINDERIRFHGRPHAGAATQSNYGLNLATSDVIARADADDEFGLNGCTGSFARTTKSEWSAVRTG